MKFSENTETHTKPPLPTTILLKDVLDEIHEQLTHFLKKLQTYFDKTKHRIGFFQISGSRMVSDIYFGATDILKDEEIDDEIMR